MDLLTTLKSERQWLRGQRIAHARYRHRTASTDDDRKLWAAVVEANGEALEARHEKARVPKESGTKDPSSR